MSTPTFLVLPDGVRRTAIETSRGVFAALEAVPGSGVCDRQPAVLVPGYTGSKEDFLAILHQLAAAGRRVLALDMRGQYETAGPDDPRAYTIGELAFDIAAVIDAVAAGAAATGRQRGPRTADWCTWPATPSAAWWYAKPSWPAPPASDPSRS